MKFKSACCFLGLVMLLFSCNQEKPAVETHVQVTVSHRSAVGVKSASPKPPVVIPASRPDVIKAGQPVVVRLAPGFGEAGGVTQMQNYTTDNGLALDAISPGHRSSICDKSGNLWFGTYGGGVSRYDGKSFTNFTTSHGLGNNVVVSIVEDSHGNIWFGTDGGGVSMYDGRSFKNYTAEDGLANNVVWSIIEDKKGDIWFGTDGGASKFDGKSFRNYSKNDGLAEDVVQCIIEDKNGNIWLGTDVGGVSRFDGKVFTNFTKNDGLAKNAILSIFEDKFGNIWFGTDGGGVSRFNGISFSNFKVAQGEGSDNVTSIMQDHSGYLWFGTSGGGVSRYNGNTFTNFTTTQGLANNIIYSITEDKRGNLWFGSDGGGLSRYDGGAFTNFTTGVGLSSNVIFCIAEDRDKNLWFGTEGGGVSKYDGSSFENYSVDQGLANNEIRSIIQDHNGFLWFGSNGKGVSKFDGKSFTTYSVKHGLTNNMVVSMLEDRHGNIWFGTYGGGVSKFDGESFTNYTTEQGLPDNVIKCIIEDSRGNIWFGTYGGGASMFDGNTFTNFTTDQGLGANVVGSIVEDKDGVFWFGTDGGGVSRYDGNSFVTYSTAQGLPDNTITNVVITKEGDLVLATNYGIGFVTGFTSTRDGKTDTIASVNRLSNNDIQSYQPMVEIYNSATGYPVKDINSGQNTMFVDSKGIIWAGTGADKTALVRFDYKALNRNPKPPVVLIQNIKINEESICWYDLDKGDTDSLQLVQQEEISLGKKLSREQRDRVLQKFDDISFASISKFYSLPHDLVLPFKKNHISFEFAAVEPARPYLVKYQYILEGYDDDWSPATNKTYVSYGNIQEGNYTFKLRALSPFGDWSEPVNYTFTILPPWYRAWWMYLGYVILGIALVYLIVRWNGRKLKARARELKAMVAEATFEISEQKQIIEDKHKAITDSLNYAERIQRSLLASKKLLDENLKEYFILFKPKDVVSGDFYWAAKLDNDHFAFVTADSTGHGVPGAIMSFLNIACLEKAIESEKLVQPDMILDHTRSRIIDTLKKDGSEDGGKDGMDCSMLCFDFKKSIMHCSASNNPVWIIRDKELIEIKPNHFPVGKHERDKESFTLHTVNLKQDDIIYTLTDGYADQFGGPFGKKFKYKALKELLLSIAHEPLDVQHHKLQETFETWKGKLEQVDDVCLVGIRISLN